MLLTFGLLCLFVWSIYDHKEKYDATVLIMSICIILFGVGFVLMDSFGTDYISEYLTYSSDNNLIGTFITSCTSAFIHADIDHLFSNMLILLIFQPLLKKVDNMTIWKLFIVGNSMSIIFIFFTVLIYYLTFGTIIVTSFTLKGASAGIFALMGFCTFNYANKNINFGIFYTKTSYLTYFLLVCSLIHMMGNSNFLGNTAHVGGFLWAYYLHKTGRDKHTLKV
jgi:membrane associated rhomboid family serine protease